MDEFRGILLLLLCAEWLVLPLVYLSYLIAATAHRGNADRRDLRYWRRTVTFHAKWGIALSIPGVTMALVGGPGSHWNLFGGVVFAATLGCWAIAMLASAGRDVPVWLTWVPLAVVLVSVVGFAIVPNLVDEGIYEASVVHGLMLETHGGLALVAWLVVAISFALSVRRVNAYAAVPALGSTPHLTSPPSTAWRAGPVR